MPGAPRHPGRAALAFFLIPPPQGEGGCAPAERSAQTGGDRFGMKRTPPGSRRKRRGLASTKRALPLAAEEKYRLLAEQVPEPPRRGEAQRRAPGVDRDRALHLGAGDLA